MDAIAGGTHRLSASGLNAINSACLPTLAAEDSDYFAPLATRHQDVLDPTQSEPGPLTSLCLPEMWDGIGISA